MITVWCNHTDVGVIQYVAHLPTFRENLLPTSLECRSEPINEECVVIEKWKEFWARNKPVRTGNCCVIREHKMQGKGVCCLRVINM